MSLIRPSSVQSLIDQTFTSLGEAKAKVATLEGILQGLVLALSCSEEVPIATEGSTVIPFPVPAEPPSESA